MTPSKVLVVLPAYNEEANIGSLLDKIEETMVGAGFLYQVIVVDDGSRDGTYEILSRHARRIPLTITRHPANEGLGAAIRDGLLAAAEAAGDNDIVITMDADETHTPGLIGCLVTMVHDGHDVVIASRYQPGARVYGVPVARMFFSYVASWSFRVLFPTRGIRDFTSGYRAYRGAALKAAVRRYGKGLVDAPGFPCMIDILLKLRKMDLSFGETPIILRYDLKEGQSKMRVVTTIRQTVVLALKRRLEL